MKQNNEHRRYRRYTADGIYGNVLNTAGLEIINISVDGAALETTRRLELNREYVFKIHHNDVNLSLRGRVIWAILMSKESNDNKDGNAFTPTYRVGLTFTHRLSENADVFLEFVEEIKIKALRNRLGNISAKIANIENVSTACPYRHEVRKLSMSGMLIETRYPFAPGSNHLVELSLDAHLLNVEGRISSCNSRSAGEIAQYDVGIDFLEVTDQDKILLKDFLRSLRAEIGLVLLFVFVLNYKA